MEEKLLNIPMPFLTLDSECNMSCATGKVCDIRLNGEEFCRRARYCDLNSCGSGEVCSNKDSACVCAAGYTRHSGTNFCVEDPCAKNVTPCHKFANCSTTHEQDGSISASCSCREGKVGDGYEDGDGCSPDKCYSGE